MVSNWFMLQFRTTSGEEMILPMMIERFLAFKTTIDQP